MKRISSEKMLMKEGYLEASHQAEMRKLFKEMEFKYTAALLVGKPLMEHSWYRRLKDKYTKGE